MNEDPTSLLRETVRQPGTVWCYHRTDSGAVRIDSAPPPAGDGVRWLHLNLSDQRSLRWIERESGLPPAVRALMLSHDAQPRFVFDGGATGLVFQDLERGLNAGSTGRLGALYIASAGDMLVTGRRIPLQSADLIRFRLERGMAPDTGDAAIAFLLDTLIDSLASLLLDLTAGLIDAEEALLADEHAETDTRLLIATRRQATHLHRLVSGMRMVLLRIEREPNVPPALQALTPRLLPRLAGLDADIAGAQSQLKMLREELDFQATQLTNRNLYLLSVLTALMMPATLVTGFFGMNTGGLPFAQGADGTELATLVAVLSAAGSYLLLRLLGLVRRR